MKSTFPITTPTEDRWTPSAEASPLDPRAVNRIGNAAVSSRVLNLEEAAALVRCSRAHSRTPSMEKFMEFRGCQKATFAHSRGRCSRSGEAFPIALVSMSPNCADVHALLLSEDILNAR